MSIVDSLVRKDKKVEWKIIQEKETLEYYVLKCLIPFQI